MDPLYTNAGLSTDVGDTLLFEMSWEVCNQVGGIYQVLRSKAEFMLEDWGDRYCVVGPYLPERAATDFEPTPVDGVHAEIIATLERQGIRAHVGRWLVAGRPRAILLEYALPAEQLNRLKHELWQHFKIESPANLDLVDNAIAFGQATALLLAAACRAWCNQGQGGRVLAHFHEWQGGVGIPLTFRMGLPLARVFTTHATMLGRYIASSRDDLYQRLSSVDVDAEATHFGIRSQTMIERVAAQYADVLTTVSPITGEECAHILGRKPCVITPNGINLERSSSASAGTRRGMACEKFCSSLAFEAFGVLDR
jgi:glycogen(starch) synthase